MVGHTGQEYMGTTTAATASGAEMEILDAWRSSWRLPSWLLLVGYVPFAYTVVGTNLSIPTLWRWMAGADDVAAFHDQQRVLQIVALLVVVTVLVCSPVVRHQAREAVDCLPRQTRLALVFLVGLGSLSSALAALPGAAFRELGLYVLLAMVSIIVAAASRRGGRGFETGVLRLLVVAAAIYVMAFAIQDIPVDRASSMFGFSNPRFFGQVALWVFPLLVTAALRPHGRPAFRLGRWLTVIGWWAVLVESSSRAAIYGSLLGVLVVAVVVRRRARRWLGGALVAIALGSATWFVWMSVVGIGAGGLTRLAEKGLDSSGRLDIWGETISLIGRRPLLGIGPEHYAYYGTFRPAHPHSAPLQLLAEWGIPATLVVAVLAIWGSSRWLSWARRDGVDQDPTSCGGHDLVPALTAALVAGAFASLVDGIWVMPASQMLMVAVIGLALGRYPSMRTAPRQPGRLGELLLAVGAVAAAAGVVIGAVPYALRPAEEVRAYVESTDERVLAPRFWLLGRLDSYTVTARTHPFRFSGNAEDYVRGTFFTPNGEVRLAGASSSDPKLRFLGAQFFAQVLDGRGNGSVELTPNEDSMVETTDVGRTMIR